MEKFQDSESVESRGEMGMAWKGDTSIQSCGLLLPLTTESVARYSNSPTFSIPSMSKNWAIISHFFGGVSPSLEGLKPLKNSQLHLLNKIFFNSLLF